MRLWTLSERFVQLAQKPRRGWTMRGIKGGETAYEHSLEMRDMAHKLVPRHYPHLDPVYAGEMCMIHDTPECVDTDWTPHDNISARQKEKWEYRALGFMRCNTYPRELMEQVYLIFDEHQKGTSPTARLTRQLDKLQLARQTLRYEQAHPQMNMHDMWDYAAKALIDLPLIRIFENLKQQRPEGIERLPLTVARKLTEDDEKLGKEAVIARIGNFDHVTIEREQAFEKYPFKNDLKSRIRVWAMRTPWIDRYLP